MVWLSNFLGIHLWNLLVSSFLWCHRDESSVYMFLFTLSLFTQKKQLCRKRGGARKHRVSAATHTSLELKGKKLREAKEFHKCVRMLWFTDFCARVVRWSFPWSSQISRFVCLVSFLISLHDQACRCVWFAFVFHLIAGRADECCVAHWEPEALWEFSA